MKFCWVTLPVKNLEASLAFYNGVLGLPIDSKHTGNGIEMAMLGEENQPKIELIYMPGNQHKTLYSDISVGIGDLAQPRALLSKVSVLENSNAWEL